MDQAQRTEGVEDTLGRPGLVNRALLDVVSWAERLNWRYSILGNRPVFATSDFPWANEVEREWHLVRAELDRLLRRKEELPGFHEIIGEVRSISTDRDWKTFLFIGFGAKSEEAVRHCPQTWRILQTIPGLKTAMFSILEPGKQLKPHRGPYNGVLRLHLGLIVPDTPRGTVAIRVDDEVSDWEEGKVLIFDDSYEHEAWNHSEQTRVVLFVDFVKPLRFPASFVNWLILDSGRSRRLFAKGLKPKSNGRKAFSERLRPALEPDLPADERRVADTDHGEHRHVEDPRGRGVVPVWVLRYQLPPGTSLVRSTVDAVEAKPQRAGVAQDSWSSPTRSVTGIMPPENTSWDITATTSSGMICSFDLASAESARPTIAAVTQVNATSAYNSRVGLE